MAKKNWYSLLTAASLLAGLASAAAPGPDAGLRVPSPDWRDQIIYFVMLDRFNDGDPRNNDQGAGEYDPADVGHYSGGDLRGLAEKLPYIKGLGATAVWITPPVAHQWWSDAVKYGGYHGYWGENFMEVDRHFGSMEDMRALSRGLHAGGMYLIQDIVVNHVGNYFYYDPTLWDPRDPVKGYKRERAVGQAGAPGQPPFDQNDARDPEQAGRGIYHWTPDIADYFDPVQERGWQLAGLDDLNTESPAVREALRRSYGYWIREAGVDGFRIDTVIHVPPAFFKDFLYSDDAAQPGIMRAAKADGREDFLVFGEGFGVEKPCEDKLTLKLESYMRDAGGALIPGMLNFPLYHSIGDVLAKGHPTSEMRCRIETMMRGHKAPYLLPSFVDNHDVDRFLVGGSSAALEQSLLLIMTLPGIPVVYYGTEQGFTVQRASMFKAGFGSGGRDRFDENAPLYKSIRAMSDLRRSNKVFTRGVPEILKDNPAGAGVFAYRMRYGKEQALVLFNTADSESLMDNLDTGLPSGASWRAAFSLTPFPETLTVGANGRLSLALPARSGVVLLPGPRVSGRSGGAAAPRIDALPEFAEGDMLEAGGRASGASAFKLVLDGDLSRAVPVTPGAGGRWRARVPIGGLVDESVPHELTAWSERDAAASPARRFRVRKVWRPALTARDPVGDDTGRTGGLRYPSDPGWGDNHQCDIEKVMVSRAGGALRIEVRMRGMTRGWGPINGFDRTALTVFLEMPGRTGGLRVMPKQNGELPAGMSWHYRLRAHGWSNVLSSSEGAGPDDEGRAVTPGAKLETDFDARTVTLTIPAASLGYPETLSGAKLYLNTWDYAEGYRPLAPESGPMIFGGGKPGDTKVMDETAVLTLP
ncbi:MAG TPA: alpha-amylase family glycosyl hydrolase [Elusimicrobiales bacterium]|nr:alpha-amylase family glycosyl hydrolase [Elusimicrobiales bacterium]